MAEAEESFLAKVGKSLRRRRLDLDLKPADVARRSGMHRSVYWALEAGRKKSVQPEQLKRLAEVLETTTDYLLQRRGDEDRGPLKKMQDGGVRDEADRQTRLPAACSVERSTVASV